MYTFEYSLQSQRKLEKAANLEVVLWLSIGLVGIVYAHGLPCTVILTTVKSDCRIFFFFFVTPWEVEVQDISSTGTLHAKKIILNIDFLYMF